MPDTPLVSIICVCYNQADYILESLQSVLQQDYEHIELIITDDASTDRSQEKIETFLAKHPTVTFLKNNINIGHCATFNKALKVANGKYIIDLAGDDVLMPKRVSNQVKAFEQLAKTYGVVFTDTYIINEKGKINGTFYSRSENGRLAQKVPSGDIYKALIRKMTLSSPTMMMRKSVLDELGGYDESLSYEDYDFWVRSGRNYKYFYLDEILTKKRKVNGSQGVQFYRKAQNQHLKSTLKICKKAQKLNKDKEEDKALAVSVAYHLQLAYLTDDHTLCQEFYALLLMLRQPSFKDQFFVFLAKRGVKVNTLYRLFLRWYRGIK